MDIKFWCERWQQNQIGFHQEDINEYLQRYINLLNVKYDETIFAPFCGKSLDLLWLQSKGFHVVAVEISELAVEQFFNENKLDVEYQESDGFTIYRSGKIKIFCGDYFHLTKGMLGEIYAVYDRAALIALPTEMRGRYVQHLQSLIRMDTSMLLITLEYPQRQMQGPPFSVMQDEINTLYSGNFTIELLGTLDVLEQNPRFKQKGLDTLIEKAYLLTRGAG